MAIINQDDPETTFVSKHKPVLRVTLGVQLADALASRFSNSWDIFDDEKCPKLSESGIRFMGQKNMWWHNGPRGV